MRDLINLITESSELSRAEALWQNMSMLARYNLIERLPYVVGTTARTNAAIQYIADNLEEFEDKARKAAEPDTRFDHIDDGGIHRII